MFQLFEKYDKTWFKIDEDQAFVSVLDGYFAYEPIFKENIKDNKICVQAGGYCGIFPYYLSFMFEKVYTFEPDHGNFACLVQNTLDRDNIIKIQTGLGELHSMSTFSHQSPINRGMNKLTNHDHGITPILRIDDLMLPSCDLICLDTEGFEQPILHGAFQTIQDFHPLICIEDNNDASIRYLESFGYNKIGHIHRDTIYG